MAARPRLPCPFCGGRLSPIAFGSTGYGVGKSLWQWSCYQCHANGPVAESVDAAQELWDRRGMKEIPMGEADSLIAGPEFAAQVAEKVMGFPRYKPSDPKWACRPYVAEFPDGGTNVYTVGSNCWRPDIDWSATGEVLERMRRQDKHVQEAFIDYLEGEVAHEHKYMGQYPGTRWTSLFMTPLAICQAALAATEARKNDSAER